MLNLVKICDGCARSDDGNPCGFFKRYYPWPEGKRENCPRYWSILDVPKPRGSCRNCLKNSRDDPCHYKRHGQTKEFCEHFISKD